MSDEMNFEFTERAVEVLRAERGDGYEGEMGVRAAYATLPVAGDLFADARLSRKTFVVVSRLFLWDESSERYGLTLLLDIAPNTDIRPAFFAIVPPAVD